MFLPQGSVVLKHRILYTRTRVRRWEGELLKRVRGFVTTEWTHESTPFAFSRSTTSTSSTQGARSRSGGRTSRMSAPPGGSTTYLSGGSPGGSPSRSPADRALGSSSYQTHVSGTPTLLVGNLRKREEGSLGS